MSAGGSPVTVTGKGAAGRSGEFRLDVRELEIRSGRRGPPVVTGVSFAVRPGDALRTTREIVEVRLIMDADRDAACVLADAAAAGHADVHDDHIGLEALAMLIDGPEWQEGMQAFMEKRPPRFPPL